MELLLVSSGLLWLGFIAMVLVNLALARQIGVLSERVAPAGALMMNQQLEAGQNAPEFSLPALDGDVVQVGKAITGKSQLLFFIAPDCPVCSELVLVLKSTAKAESDWLQVVLASDGEELDHQDYVRKKGLSAFPYVVSELLGRAYGVAKLPYAVLIDEQGVVVSMGIVNSREHLESLFEAKELKVASLQEYIKKKGGVHSVEVDKTGTNEA